MQAISKDMVILTLLLAISLTTIFFLRSEQIGTTGFVVCVPGQENQTYNAPTINLSCSFTSNENMINITATIIDEEGKQETQTAAVNSNSLEHNFTFTNLNNGEYDYTCSACTNGAEGCNSSQTQQFTVEYNVTTIQFEPVLNLTFDDENNPYKDYSNLNHKFTSNGMVNRIENNDYCKWYGCLDLTDTSGDYLLSNTKFALEDEIAISFWVYHKNEVGSSNGQAYYQIGTGEDLKWTQQSGYGYSTTFKAENGEVSTSIGGSLESQEGRYEQVFIQYDGTTLKTYINSELKQNATESFGNLNHAIGEMMQIGRGQYGIDIEGYLDEFLIWNRGNFTQEEITQMYNAKKEGTPPELDLYVENVSYALPYDWSDDRNSLDITGNLQINITIVNAGTENTGTNFNTDVVIDGNTICSINTNGINAREKKELTCDYPMAQGWHKGTITVDANEDIDETSYSGGREDNNIDYLFIPLENHPRLRFSREEWNQNFKPWFTNTDNELVYSSYNWYKNFLSSDFNPSYSAQSVDPYAKKGYQNALTCLINNYTGTVACQRAKNHLEGWLINTTGYADVSVQNLHELIHVGATYDLMFPVLTEEEATSYAKRLSEICFEVFGKDNVRPDQDTDEPTVGNGKGFGLGMAGICQSVLGDYNQNPNLEWDDPQNYQGINTITSWNYRIKNFLEGFKNDTNSYYPEGMSYKWYSQYHFVDVMRFLQRTNISTLSTEHQTTLCAMAKEPLVNMLDHTYDGETLRGDESHNFRQISFGDTNSYDRVGNDGYHGWDVISAFGVLCDDAQIKSAVSKLRYLAYEVGDETRGPGALYYYSTLEQEVSKAEDISKIMPPYIFSESFDRLTIRRGYDYTNDTMFIIDAGEEAGGGHPHASFDLFSYVYGEPFLDYPQVPFEDDIRSEVYHNTISFTQSTATGYNNEVDQAALNQYYGGGNTQGTYPDQTYMPEAYRGDVINTMGTETGNYASAYTYKPYTTTTKPVVRAYVLFDDLLVHMDVIHRTEAGTMYANWINIYDEFTPLMSGENLTLTRTGTNKHYKIMPIWSSAGTITLAGGDSGKQYCFKKTDCSPGGKGNYGKYYHSTSGTDSTTIYAHHWYLGSDQTEITKYLGTDKGIRSTKNQETRYIILDTDESGEINELGYQTNGWSLSLQEDNIIASANTSNLTQGEEQIYQSEQKTNIYLDFSNVTNTTGTISTETNTEVYVTLKGAISAVVRINEEIISSSITNGLVKFSVPKGNNHFSILKTGDASPQIQLNSPANSANYNESETITLNCTGNDQENLANVKIYTNETGSMQIKNTENALTNTQTITYSKTYLKGLYAWKCEAEDNESKQTTSQTRTFTVQNEAGSEEENNSNNNNILPQITLIAPNDQQVTIQTETNFRCAGTDEDGTINKITLYLNKTGFMLEEHNTINEEINYTTTLAAGVYAWKCEAEDNQGNTTMSQTRIFKIADDSEPPSAEGFNGQTTNFSNIADYNNVSGIILENEQKGKINFTEKIMSIAGINFTEAIIIENKNLTVKTGMYPSLNVSAQITFYNITLQNPKLQINGRDCTEQEYSNQTYEGGNYSVNIFHFTSYSLIEEQIPSQEISDEESSSHGSLGGGSSRGVYPETKIIVNQTNEETNLSDETTNETQSQELTKNEPTENLEEIKKPETEQPTQIIEENKKSIKDQVKWLTVMICSFLVFSIALFGILGKHKEPKTKETDKIKNTPNIIKQKNISVKRNNSVHQKRINKNKKK